LNSSAAFAAVSGREVQIAVTSTPSRLRQAGRCAFAPHAALMMPTRRGRELMTLYSSGDGPLVFQFLDPVPIETEFHQEEFGMLRRFGSAGVFHAFMIELYGVRHQPDWRAAISALD